MQKYMVEFVGTFFLVLTIGLVAPTGTPIAALAIGAVLMCMVYMGGHTSGAHYNPAVSLAVLIRGKLSWPELGTYVVVQLAAAIVAALGVYGITGKTTAIEPAKDTSIHGALLVELLFTFALALVVLNVATSKKTEGNSHYGLAIGFTIAAAAASGGPVSGGAFNPAVGIGLTLIKGLDGGAVKHVWLYIVGPLLGGALAALVFKFQESGKSA